MLKEQRRRNSKEIGLRSLNEVSFSFLYRINSAKQEPLFQIGILVVGWFKKDKSVFSSNFTPYTQDRWGLASSLIGLLHHPKKQI